MCNDEDTCEDAIDDDEVHTPNVYDVDHALDVLQNLYLFSEKRG